MIVLVKAAEAVAIERFSEGQLGTLFACFKREIGQIGPILVSQWFCLADQHGASVDVYIYKNKKDSFQVVFARESGRENKTWIFGMHDNTDPLAHVECYYRELIADYFFSGNR